MIKRLVSYMRYQWVYYTLGMLLIIVSSATTIYLPLIVKQWIDFLSQTKELTGDIFLQQSLKMALWYLLLTIVSGTVRYSSYRLLSRASNLTGKRLRDDVHIHMQQLPVSYFDDKPAGKISSRIINDTELVRQSFFLTVSTQFVWNIVLVMFVYGALYMVNTTVAIYMLVLIPIMIIWQWSYMRLATPATLTWRESVSELNSHTAEIVSGASIAQLYGQQDAIMADFDKTNATWFRSRRRLLVIDSVISWDFATLLKNIVIGGVLLYVGRQYSSHVFAMSVGTLYVLIDYVGRIFDPLNEIVRLTVQLQQALAGAKRVFEMLDTPVEDDCDERLQLKEGAVEFRNVSFGYNPEQLVLRDININARQGETIGLVGHTGSGKSSLINLLFRFYDVQKGAILIDGQNIQNYNRESIREHMGIVLQEPFLFTGTIASNISMHDENITDEMIEKAIDKVGARDFINKLPKGIHEPVVERGQSFSSGERQLISFARTLVANPQILILDEATSHIDTQTEEIIQRAMEVVKEGRTTFIIAHRLSTIQHANQIIVLDAGRIIERGTHQELLEQDGHYAEMYRLQSQV